MSSPISIHAANITKRYGDKTALDDISFDVSKGELFGFIGPDGAGKTTLFRLITTLLIPDKGSLTVEGLDTVKDYIKLRKILGYMPGRFSLYQDLTVEENLRFFAGIFKTTPEANYELVKDIYSQIEPFKDRKAGKLSGGMKQKLALSCALIHKPEVLVLDEPTTGVDAVSRIEFWEMLSRLRLSGITIVVSTPYMDEASRCDRVALIQSGKIMSINTPAAIRNNYGQDLWAIKTDDTYRLLGDLRQFKYTRTAFPFGEHIHLSLSDKSVKPAEILAYLETAGHSNVHISKIEPSIEDCFMEMMKKE
ncbi:MAG: ABC transporter ATP-binding protein [Bacteroidales bacterium]|nr:ABC transporter ATP-binding protein [Bacteroidales bacterium]